MSSHVASSESCSTRRRASSLTDPDSGIVRLLETVSPSAIVPLPLARTQSELQPSTPVALPLAARRGIVDPNPGTFPMARETPFEQRILGQALAGKYRLRE